MNPHDKFMLKKLLSGSTIVSDGLLSQQTEYQTLVHLEKQGLVTRKRHPMLPAWEFAITDQGKLETLPDEIGLDEDEDLSIDLF